MNHLFIETDLSTKIISNIISRFLDVKRIITSYNLDLLDCYLKKRDLERLKSLCYSISGSISRNYKSTDYLTNCLYTKINDKDAIQITIPISKQVWNKIVLYPSWKIQINIPIEGSNIIFGPILAYLTFEEGLGKEKIKLDHKESTVGIGLATISMLVSDNISEAKILEDMGQDVYFN